MANKKIYVKLNGTSYSYPNATSASEGYMSASDKSKLDAVPTVTTITKSLKVTSDWMDTGIAGTNLATGMYAVYMSLSNISSAGLYQESWAGIMSWFAGGTNSTNSDEILLHNAGHADNANEVYLRTLRQAASASMKLQIAAKQAFSEAASITFSFRKLS